MDTVLFPFIFNRSIQYSSNQTFVLVEVAVKLLLEFLLHLNGAQVVFAVVNAVGGGGGAG